MQFAEVLIAKSREPEKCLEIQPDYPQARLVVGQIILHVPVFGNLPAQDHEDYREGTPMTLKNKRPALRVAASKKIRRGYTLFEPFDQDLGYQSKLQMMRSKASRCYDLLITDYEQRSGHEGKKWIIIRTTFTQRGNKGPTTIKNSYKKKKKPGPSGPFFYRYWDTFLVQNYR